MATKFDNNLFSVQLDSDGRLPMPTPDENDLRTYTATIWMASGAVQDAIQDLHSKVTVVNAMGGGGILITERGPGWKTLYFPTGNGEEQRWRAILIDFQPHPLNMRDTDRTADATWYLASRVS